MAFGLMNICGVVWVTRLTMQMPQKTALAQIHGKMWLGRRLKAPTIKRRFTTSWMRKITKTDMSRLVKVRLSEMGAPKLCEVR